MAAAKYNALRRAARSDKAASAKRRYSPPHRDRRVDRKLWVKLNPDKLLSYNLKYLSKNPNMLMSKIMKELDANMVDTESLSPLEELMRKEEEGF